MEQPTPLTTVNHLIGQANGIKLLKSTGFTSTFPRMLDHRSHKLPILVLSDAGRQSDLVQLCYIAGLLGDEMNSGSLFHS